MTERINRCSHCGCDEPMYNAIDGKLYCNICGMSLEKLEGGLTMGRKYCYNEVQYDFARVIIDDIRKEIEPSMDKWDRAYNSGLTTAIRIIKKYRENYEANHRVIKEG